MWKEYIKEQGVEIIAKKMRVTRSTVYNWLNEPSTMSEQKRQELIKISRNLFGMVDWYK